MFARAYKRLPLGGKLARQRLMRGDIFALPRGMYLSHETERHMGRSAFRSLTNLNHFYPVAEMRQGNKLPPCQYRLTGLVSEQPEIVARNMATPKSAQTKSKEQKSPCLKFLKVLKTSFKKFSSRVRGNAPRSSPVRTPSDRTCDPASPWTAPSQQDDRGGRR